MARDWDPVNLACLSLQGRPRLHHPSATDRSSKQLEGIHTESALASVTPYVTRYPSKESIPKFRVPREGSRADVVSRLRVTS
jgi:hypothetical protein